MRRRSTYLSLPLALIFSLCIPLYAQKITSKQLPTPQELASQLAGTKNTGKTNGFGWGKSVTSTPGDILYGATPTTVQGPVILFIHGYRSNPETWYDGNDMYDLAYKAGYRTAFVALGPKENMWINAKMLDKMLPQIVSHYGVQKVVVVAHSKGGVDTDAFLNFYQGHKYVHRTITLSTPHHGSPLADLAHSSILSPIAEYFADPNPGSFCLQTGYMSFFRQQIATKEQQLGLKHDFRCIGAWGFFKSFMLFTPGLYMNNTGFGPGGGGNDGVVPCFNALRPGSKQLMHCYGDNRTKYHHTNIRTGSNIWSNLKGSFIGFKKKEDEVESVEDYSPYTSLTSNYHYVVSTNGKSEFLLEPHISGAEVTIYTRSGNSANVTLTSPSGLLTSATPEKKLMKTSTGRESITIPINAPEAGKYKVAADEAFVAVITSKDGVEMTFRSDLSSEKKVFEVAEKVELGVDLQSNGYTDVNNATVTGVLRYTGNLDGEMTENPSPIPVTLHLEREGNYSVSIEEGLAPGVYSVILNAESNEFKKSIATSFAVVGEELDQGNNAPFELRAYPNPSSGPSTIALRLAEPGSYNLQLFNAIGQEVKSVKLENLGAGIHEVSMDFTELGLESGYYIFQLSDGKDAVTQSVIFNK